MRVEINRANDRCDRENNEKWLLRRNTNSTLLSTIHGGTIIVYRITMIGFQDGS